MLGGGVRLLRLGHAQAQRVVDQLPAVHVPPVDERDGDAGPARPAGAADPVHVGLLVVRALVVHHVGDVVHVEPAGGDLGGGEHVHLAAAERAQRPLPLALAQVTVHGGHREAPAGQRGRDLVGGPLGLAEHDGQAAVPGLQDPGQHLDLVHLVRPEHMLPGEGGGRGLVVSLGPDVDRAPHVAAGERDDVAGHGRGEQHGLPLFRDEPDDPLHVGQEAEVEHLVRLVEHQRADRAQVQVAALGQVEEPARGTDDDVDAGRQRVDLRFVGAAAVDGQHLHPHVDRGDAQVVGDLDRQFPGGHDHEGLRQAALPVLLDQLEQRDAERHERHRAGLHQARGALAAGDQAPAKPREVGFAVVAEADDFAV